MEAYGIMNPTPAKRLELVGAIEQWKKQHDIYVAATNPRVIPDAIVTNMVALKDEMQNFWAAAIAEKEEASEAYATKQETFTEDTDKLRILYTIAKMTWGNDDPKLTLLGFVPFAMYVE